MNLTREEIYDILQNGGKQEDFAIIESYLLTSLRQEAYLNEEINDVTNEIITFLNTHHLCEGGKIIQNQINNYFKSIEVSQEKEKKDALRLVRENKNAGFTNSVIIIYFVLNLGLFLALLLLSV